MELIFGHMVRSVDETCVELDDGAEIPTRTVVWAGRGHRRGHRGLHAGGPERDRTVGWWSTRTSPSAAGATPSPWVTRPRCPGIPHSPAQPDDLPPAGPGGHPVGRARRRPDSPPDRRPAHRAVPLPRQGHHGHHRPAGGGDPVPPGTGDPGHARLVGLAGSAHPVPHRVPQQDHRPGQLVVAVPVLGIGAKGHRRRRARIDGGRAPTGRADRAAGSPAGRGGLRWPRWTSALAQIDRKVLQLFALVG